MNNKNTYQTKKKNIRVSNSHRLGAGFTRTEIILLITFVSIIATWSLFDIVRTGREARDIKRVGDIHIIRNRLEQFFIDKQEYPEGQMIALGKDSRIADCEGGACTFLTEDGWTGTPVAGRAYLINIPSDPSGAQVRCLSKGNTDPCIYTYTSDSRDTFRLYFYLEGPVDRLKGGSCVADNVGIRCDGE